MNSSAMASPFPPNPQTSCESQWRGKTRRFALALYEGFIHFWEPDSSEYPTEEWVYCAEGQINVSSPEILEDAMLHHFKRAIEHKEVGRPLHLADTICVFLREQEESSLHFHLGEVEERFSFYLDDHEELFNRPASHWIEQLEKRALESVENCDFAEGLIEHSVPFSHYGRAEMLLMRGNYAEMECIADLIFSLEPAWIERNNGNVLIILHAEKPARLVVTMDCKVAHCIFTSHPRSLLWHEWLRFFQPTLDTEAHRADLKVGERLFSCGFGPQAYFDQWDDAMERGDANFKPLTELSQHERMEIVLPLGQWLREQAQLPPERIADLLR